ncbi:MAG: hypothetical protein C5B59_08265 [Bacteroidetes bacterium]|nr:MAG: hypothetical protein C5B59_08265 [Bacteroidota bacterium]
MTLPGRPSLVSFHLLSLLILFFALQLVVAFLTYGYGFCFDEAMWQYIGRNWFRHGMVPYRGGVDNKSPLIFAIYGLSDKLFGVNFILPRILGAVSQTIGLFFVYKIGWNIAEKRTALLALTLYGLSLLWRGTGGKYVSFTESYSVTAVIISFYFFLTAQKPVKFFLSGFFAGIGAAFRLTSFFPMAAILVLAATRNKKMAFVFFLGSLTGVLLFILFLWLSRININDFIAYGITDNFRAGSATDHSILWKLENFFEKFFYSELVLFYPGLVGYFFIAKKNNSILVWLLAAFIGINVVGIYDRVHLKEILPALSLLNAFAIAHLIEHGKLPVQKVMIIIWIVFFPKLLEPLVGLKKWITHEGANAVQSGCQPTAASADEYTQRELGRWIRSNTSAEARVLVAGYSAEIQAYSERMSPSIYFNATQTERAKHEFMEELTRHKPEMILIPRFASYQQNVSPDTRRFIDNFVEMNYTYDSCRYGYAVYKKRD